MMLSLPRCLICIFLLSTMSSRVALADPGSWPKWRGPSDNGSVEKGEFPIRFDADRVTWRTALPGKGCSTPILIQDKIILTAPVDGKDAVMALDESGKTLWQTTFGPEDKGKHRNGSGSNASPVTDGDGIFVYFKSGTLAAVDGNGEIRWSTNLVERYGKDTLFWDHGTSPVLTKQHVVMARMHRGESWLAAFDKQDGSLAWKTPRNYKTPTEGDHGYSTPLVIRHDGREALLVWGGQHLTIHDAANGTEMWSCGDFNPENKSLWPSISTPVIVGNMATVAFGRNDRGIPRLHGIRLDGQGDVTKTNRIWKRDDVGTFVPSAVAYQGRVYLVGDKGKVHCIDPATGKTIWQAAFPKSRSAFYASPLIAAGRLYAPREDGVVFVASVADDKFELLAENDMGEPIIGSPVPGDNRIYLRGIKSLFCIASK